MSDAQQPDDECSTWNPGDRVWLLPDGEKREVRSPQPGIVIRVLPSGRVKVAYIEHRCKLEKTVDPKRIKARDIVCHELRERA